MTDYVAELNRVIEHLAARPDVVLTALTGGKGDDSNGRAQEVHTKRRLGVVI